MFTGIVKGIGTVESLSNSGSVLRMSIVTPLIERLSLGESICVSGICLTVATLQKTGFEVDIMSETQRLTTLHTLTPGSLVNLEPSLTASDTLGGGIVTGHVDGIGKVVSLDTETGDYCVGIHVPSELLQYLTRKGSVTLDGVNLTITSVDDTTSTAYVALIPHTREVTTLSDLSLGQHVNIEVDLIARYLQRLTATSHPIHQMDSHNATHGTVL